VSRPAPVTLAQAAAAASFFWQIWEKTRGTSGFLVGGFEDFLFFHSVGNFIIPTDELFHIFHRGRLKPPSSFTRVYMSLYDFIVIWIQCCET
jgi:hypothetical protein